MLTGQEKIIFKRLIFQLHENKKSLNISYENLSEKSNVPISTLTRIFKYNNTSLIMFIKICNALGLELKLVEK